MTVRVSLCFVLSAVCSSSSMAEESVVQERAIEPSDEETLTLEYINRYRAHPAADIQRILRGAQAGFSGMGDGLNIEKCRADVAALPAVPPLVFNMKLLTAARWHAHYLAVHEVTQHHEDKSLAGYTGASPGERVRLAGYAGGNVMENAYGFSVSPWNSHQGYIIDWGPGPDGMQNPAGHRLALSNPYVREIGCGVIRYHEKNFMASVHNLGNNRTVARYVGGVVFKDANRNEFYDCGEGLAQADVRVDTGERCDVWTSGAFTLALTHNDATTVTCSYNGQEWSQSIPAGTENVHIAFSQPDAKAGDRVDAAIAKVEIATERQRRNAAITCWLATRGYTRSPEQEARMDRLCGEHVAALEEAQEKVRQALYTGKKSTFNKALRGPKMRYRLCAAKQWFADAAAAFPAYADALKVLKAIRAQKPQPYGRITKIRKKVHHMSTSLETLEFQELLVALDLLFSHAIDYED